MALLEVDNTIDMMNPNGTYVMVVGSVYIMYGIEVDVIGVTLLEEFINNDIDNIYSVDGKKLLLKQLIGGCDTSNPKIKKVLIGVKVCPETDIPGAIPMDALLYSSLEYEYIVQDIIVQNDKLKVLFLETSPVYWILDNADYKRLY